jgi:hypothetical protein
MKPVGTTVELNVDTSAAPWSAFAVSDWSRSRAR